MPGKGQNNKDERVNNINNVKRMKQLSTGNGQWNWKDKNRIIENKSKCLLKHLI